MIYLCMAMVVLGFIGFMLAACENYDAANVAAWIVGILLVIFWISKKLRDDDSSSTYCEDTCSDGGGGKKIKFTVGLGQHGNVPTYTEVSCPKRGGKGRV